MADLSALRAALARHPLVARLVVAGHDGSSPREAGAEMLVWPGGSHGTIGGGALEWEATGRALALLEAGAAPGHLRLDREALGPKLGQCCGGRVEILTEILGPRELAAREGLSALALPATDAARSATMPLALRRILARARDRGEMPQPGLVQGWMVELLERPRREIWIWGAGHVGRAMTGVLTPLPDVQITWIDTARARFPDVIEPAIVPIWSERPELLADHAPRHAEHLILTYSHALDLELCHRLLRRGAGWIGLIGSDTKWARFRSRLAALGHSATSIAGITCPIGDTGLGKHPQAIALGVAVQLLKMKRQSETEIADDDRGDDARRPARARTRRTAAHRGRDQGLSGGGRQQ